MAALAAAMLAVTGCTDSERVALSQPTATPSPSTSPRKNPLCQPFPDRLIDEFLAAYNGRDLEALEELVVASEIEDVVAGAYGGDSSFAGVEEWARTAWNAGDRIRNSGYGAFHPSKTGFQMLITRSSERLSEEGIERVSHALNADTDGCAITSLASAGPVQAMKEPCAFYARFASVPDVDEAEPRSCADGSAVFARSGSSVASMDGRALIWGGSRGGHFTYGDVAMDGLLVDPRSDRASRVDPLDAPPFRPEAAAWTESEFIVIGSKIRPDYGVVAAAYSPDAGSWRRIDFPFHRHGGFEGVWTGTEFVLWGGPERSGRPSRRGLAYNPATDTWRKTAPAPGGGRWSHAVVWTGEEMIVFGGSNSDADLASGLAYEPASDTWRTIAPSPLSPRQWLPLTWTGREVIAWGGSSFSRNVADGAAYDPLGDSWRKLPRAPLKGRHYHSATWTGSEMVIFGGYNYRRSFADGAAYEPATDRWRRLPKAPVKPRFDHAAVWTGSDLLIFGGTWDFGHFSLGDGATYDAATNRWRRLVPNLTDKD